MFIGLVAGLVGLALGTFGVLVVGDAQLADARVEAPAQLARLAPRHGLAPTALASQCRADRAGGAPRGEHLVLLTRE